MDNTPPQTPVPTPTPPPAPYQQQNDELGVPATAMFEPDRSKRNKILIIIAVVILLVAGAAVWWFVLRSKPAKPAAQNNTSSHTQTSTTAATTKHNIYLLSSGQHNTSDIQRLDTATGGLKTVGSYKDQYVAYVELPDGTIRTLTSKSATGTDGSTTGSIVLQDNNSAPKTIFSEVIANKAGTIGKILWPGAMNADGTKVYFYESDNMGKTSRVAVVDTKGAVTDLITYKTADGKAGLGQFKGVVTPGYVSKDEKTIYFNEHSCLNCDGPPIADVVAYDVPSKTFSQPFVDPAYVAGKSTGYWTKLSDDIFTVRADSLNANFSLPPYADMVAKSKTQIYLFDTRTKKATKVFDTDTDNFNATALNLSADGKTFYYYTDKIVEDSALNAAGSGHEYHYQTGEIRAYDIAGAKTKTVDLGLSPTVLRPLFLTSNGTSYLYGVASRTSPFAESTAIVDPILVYKAAVATPTDKGGAIATFEAKDVSAITYLDFAVKQ